MGRHVNHQDYQDKMMSKFSKTAKHNKLEDRDPDTLTLKEQIELAKKKNAVVPVEKIKKPIPPRFTGQK